MVYIDYLQIFDIKGDNRNLEIGKITRTLKKLAKDLQISIILLSQLNRAVETRALQEPKLSDLRDSGSIEQDADIVTFIYRPGYYEPDNPDVANITDLIIAKHRNGPVGKVQLYFHPERLRFMSLDKRHE